MRQGLWQWQIDILDFVRKPIATEFEKLMSNTIAVTSTHAILILQIYAGAIKNRVPPLFPMQLVTAVSLTVADPEICPGRTG